MRNMFTNYNYISDDYIPNNCDPKPLSHKPVKLPLEEVNIRGEFIGLSWNCNDTVLLELQTTGDVLYDLGMQETAEDYLSDKNFIITFYNFRYEIVYQETVCASADCKYYVGPELQKVLIPNTYSMSVELVDAENNIKQTLISRSDFKIFVR